MTTALDMLPAIGATVLVRFENLSILCTVKNVKNSWGKPRLLIAPVAGEGEQWIELGRVTVPAYSREAAAERLAHLRNEVRRAERVSANLNRPDREGLNRPAIGFRQNGGC